MVVRKILLSFGFSILKKDLGGGSTSRFASRHFPKSLVLANCAFVGRPFVACYASSIIFSLFLILGSPLLVMQWIVFGYSLTNRRKTVVFDDFRLFWAFFGHLFLSFLK